MDKDGNQSRIYEKNIRYTTTCATYTSNRVNLPASMQNNTFPNANLLCQQNSEASNYGQSPSNSIKN